jgi:uroporphyrinogen-III synthase
MPLPVIVTRPEAAGDRLAAALRERGFDALWLPAFDLGPAPDPRSVERVLAHLEKYDLVVFVSPAAVRAAVALCPAEWPAAIVIGAVGAATAGALRDEMPAAAAARIVAPPDPGEDSDAQPSSGSEALWSALEAAGVRPRRVLLLRAEGGRDWLLERWRAAGVDATPLAVYARRAHRPTSAQTRWLDAHADRPAVASVITSSEAVDTLMDHLRAWPGLLAAARMGPALASHPRIASRLREAGFADVRRVRPEAAAIAECLADDGGATA